jgi:HK97 family phage major capsid protein
MNQLQTMTEELHDKRKALAQFIGDDWQSRKFTEAEQSDIAAREKELGVLHDQVKAREAIEEAAKRNSDELKQYNTPVDSVGHGNTNASQPTEQKSLGTLFTESAAWKAAGSGAGRKRMEVDLPNYELKTTMTTAAGWAPVNARTNIVIPLALRRPVVADLVPQDPTINTSIKYMEETTFTNNAATVAENAAKPESALAFTERTALVVKIATWIPVTEEQLEDVPAARSTIDNRLSVMLALAEETELLTGDGSANHLDGFLHKVTQSQAKGGDPTPTAIYKSFTKIRFTGFAEPSGIVMHPNDWEAIATLQDGFGNYIWGRPFDAGPVARLWGVPVIVSPAETENTALVGDFSTYSHISRRTGVTLRTSDQHSTNFIYNVLVILIEERLSLEIYRPSAFCLVTGI